VCLGGGGEYLDDIVALRRPELALQDQLCGLPATTDLHGPRKPQFRPDFIYLFLVPCRSCGQVGEALLELKRRGQAQVRLKRVCLGSGKTERMET